MIFYSSLLSILVELINSQVLLHGTETRGAIIVTSGNATILKRLHHPSNVTGDIVNKMNKVTWRGKIRNLQVRKTFENCIKELWNHAKQYILVLTFQDHERIMFLEHLYFMVWSRSRFIEGNFQKYLAIMKKMKIWSLKRVSNYCI